MKYRVVQWSTGNVGQRTLRSIIARPELDLVGVWVSSDAKAGKDAGELAGLDDHSGWPPPQTRTRCSHFEPDCIVHTAMADDRLMEAMEDLKRFRRAESTWCRAAPCSCIPDGHCSPIWSTRSSRPRSTGQATL